MQPKMKIKTYDRELVWIPEGVDTGAYAKKIPLIKYSGRKIKRFWIVPTLNYKKPEKWVVLQHQITGFLEDVMHDYNVVEREGVKYINYHGSCMNGGCWAILELEHED